MNVLADLDNKQEEFVRKCFDTYVKGEDSGMIRYSSHALEEMDNDS